MVSSGMAGAQCVGGGWGQKRARERIRSQNTQGLWAMLAGWLHLILLRICADNGDENWRPEYALSYIRKVTTLQAWARAGDCRVLVGGRKASCTKWARRKCEVATEGWGSARVTAAPSHGSVTTRRGDSLLLTWQSP